MTDKLVYRKADYDGDIQQISIDVADGTLEADVSTLYSQIDAWIAGENRGAFHSEQILGDTGQASSDVTVQGALQCIAEVVDAVTGRSYMYRLGIPDLSKVDDIDTDPAWVKSGGLTVANPAHADWPTLQQEFADNVLSPLGNAVTLERLYIEE